MINAVIPMPLQIVIDDVGWWSGCDGHDKQQPYRTGIDRNHVPADYEAIASLGRQLRMRPQAAMILCEWDMHNILRDLPHSTWMATRWDNHRWVGPWLYEAADILRSHRYHIELTLHGLGHEYWDDQGILGRAEWHDEQGHMRPRDHVQRHLEYFGKLLNEHDLGPFPESFVPCAWLHRFGAAEEGIDLLLRAAGIRYTSTPFHTMFRSRPPQGQRFGVHNGVITIDRGMGEPPWNAINHHPADDIAHPICGLHWPAILHPDPLRNEEAVSEWVAFLKPYDGQLDRMLSRDTADCWTQLVYHERAIVHIRRDELLLDFRAVDSLPSAAMLDTFTVKISAPSEVRFVGDDLCIERVVWMAEGQHHVLFIRRHRKSSQGTIRFQSCSPVGMRLGPT